MAVLHRFYWQRGKEELSHTGLLLVLGNWFSYTFGENSEGVAMSVGDTNANTTPGPWNREQYVQLTVNHLIFMTSKFGNFKCVSQFNAL